MEISSLKTERHDRRCSRAASHAGTCTSYDDDDDDDDDDEDDDEGEHLLSEHHLLTTLSTHKVVNINKFINYIHQFITCTNSAVDIV